MKVFKMNDCDWWMDVDIESAKRNYLEYCGCDEDSLDDVFELPVDTLKQTMISFPDEPEREKYTFLEHMGNVYNDGPHLFASTEY